MKRLTGAVALLFIFAAVAMAAPVDLGLPANQLVNFSGFGFFDQDPPPDPADPLAAPPIGTELFGLGAIQDVRLFPIGTKLWDPNDVGGNFEMNFSFWNAIVETSDATWQGVPGASNLQFNLTYEDGARLLLIQDYEGVYNTIGAGDPADFQREGDPNPGYHPSVYEDTADQDVFLEMVLTNMASTFTWSPTFGWQGGTFIANSLQVVGGVGADQVQQFGQGNAFVLSFLPEGPWLYAAEVDVILRAIPAPTALISLLTGLVFVGGYGFKRRGRAA